MKARTSMHAALHVVWWQLFTERLEARKLTIPTDLSGTIRIVVQEGATGGGFYWIHLNGPQTSFGEGVSKGVSTTVWTHEEAIQKMYRRLEKNDPTTESPIVFRMTGDESLFLSLLV